MSPRHDRLIRSFHEDNEAVLDAWCQPDDAECVSAHVKNVPPELRSRIWKPIAPDRWDRDPRAWMTNHQINAVMVQYDHASEYHFAYLGAVCIDFCEQVRHLRSFDVRSALSRGKTMLGVIVNLDVCGGTGTHWVALFCQLDPRDRANFGARFFDSAGKGPPVQIRRFAESLKKQVELIYPGTSFDLSWDGRRRQFGDSECGMFCINFLVDCIRVCVTGKRVEDVDVGDDDCSFRSRSVHFRPSPAKKLGSRAQRA